MINKELCDELFEYREGQLYWKKPTSEKFIAGCKAGSFDGRYIKIGINKKRFYAHKIIFMMHHRYSPENVDHINGIKTDNRIENLRDARWCENTWNSKIGKRNKSGIKGVNWHKAGKKWMASCMANGISHYLGLYANISDAENAVKKFRLEIHHQFANHG